MVENLAIMLAAERERTQRLEWFLAQVLLDRNNLTCVTEGYGDAGADAQPEANNDPFRWDKGEISFALPRPRHLIGAMQGNEGVHPDPDERHSEEMGRQRQQQDVQGLVSKSADTTVSGDDLEERETNAKRQLVEQREETAPAACDDERGQPEGEEQACQETEAVGEYEMRQHSCKRRRMAQKQDEIEGMQGEDTFALWFGLTVEEFLRREEEPAAFLRTASCTSSSSSSSSSTSSLLSPLGSPMSSPSL